MKRASAPNKRSLDSGRGTSVGGLGDSTSAPSRGSRAASSGRFTPSERTSSSATFAGHSWESSSEAASRPSSASSKAAPGGPARRRRHRPVARSGG